MFLPSDEFIENLAKETIQAITEGSRKIVIWGVGVNSLQFLSKIRSLGALEFISGLIDNCTTIQGQTFFGLEVHSPKTLPQLELDTLVIASDKDKESILQEFSRMDTRIPRVILGGDMNYEFDDPIFYETVASCLVKSKAGGYPNMLIHLYQSLKYIAKKNVPGSIAEFGAYQGGTTVFIAKVLRHYGRYTTRIYGFDTFKGFPQKKSALDIYQNKKYEFLDFEAVKSYCSSYNIELVQGDICETYAKLKDIQLAFSFFDTDNYSPTKYALELCIEQTVQGGILAFDHYYSPGWSGTVGERIAIRQVLDRKPVFNLYGTGIFIKL